jgi:tetratricopeptide (TPR) repeat protein
MSRVEQLKKLITITPNDPMPHYGLGLEYVNLQRWAEAAAAFDAAIAADAKYSAAYYHKARAQIAAADIAQAKVTLNDGVAIARQAGDWHTEGEMKELLATIE